MAIAYVRTGGLVDGSNITAYTWNPVTAIGSGNCIVGCVSWGTGSGATLTSITDNQGNTYNHSTPFTFSGNSACAFWLGNITNAPTTLTTTLSAGGSTHRGVFAEYSGASLTSNPTDGNTGQGQTAPGSGADAITSGSLVTTQNGDVIWGGVLNISFQAQAVAGTGFTSRADGGVSTTIWSEDKAQGTAGTTAATFTRSAAGDTITFVIAVALPSTAAPFVQTNWPVSASPGQMRPQTTVQGSSAMVMPATQGLPLMGAICM